MKIGWFSPLKVAGLAAASFGAALVLIGIAYGVSLASAAGGLMLLFLFMVVLLSMHRRVGAAMELAAATRVDLEEMKGSKRNDYLEKRVSARIERMRKEVKQRVAFAGRDVGALVSGESKKADRLHGQMSKRLEELLAQLDRQRVDALDIQTLVLRAFRESSVQAEVMQSELQTTEEKRRADSEALHEHLGGLTERIDALSSALQEAGAAREERSVRHSKLVEERRRADSEHLRERLGELIGHSDSLSSALQEANVAREERSARCDALVEEWGSSLKDVLGAVKSVSNKIGKAEYEMVQEIEALLQLQKLLDLPMPPPLLGGWAMDPLAMLGLVNHVLETKPSLIVECGSGTSTIWLAHALKANGNGRIISLEHSEKFAMRTVHALKQHHLEEVAQVQLAPLTEVEVEGESFSWYAIDTLVKLRDVDLLLIDGPPGSTGALARYPALPMLSASLSPRALIVLDDANRPQEKEVADRWRKEFPQIGEAFDIAPRTHGFIWGAGS